MYRHQGLRPQLSHIWGPVLINLVWSLCFQPVEILLVKPGLECGCWRITVIYGPKRSFHACDSLSLSLASEAEKLLPSIPVSVSVSYRTALDSIGSVGHVSELSPDVTKMKIFIWGEREREEKRERDGIAESIDWSVSGSDVPRVRTTVFITTGRCKKSQVLQNLISFGFTSV